MTLRQDLAAPLAAIPAAELPKFATFHERYAPHFDAITRGL